MKTAGSKKSRAKPIGARKTKTTLKMSKTFLRQTTIVLILSQHGNPIIPPFKTCSCARISGKTRAKAEQSYSNSWKLHQNQELLPQLDPKQSQEKRKSTKLTIIIMMLRFCSLCSVLFCHLLWEWLCGKPKTRACRWWLLSSQWLACRWGVWFSFSPPSRTNLHLMLLLYWASIGSFLVP